MNVNAWCTLWVGMNEGMFMNVNGKCMLRFGSAGGGGGLHECECHVSLVVGDQPGVMSMTNGFKMERITPRLCHKGCARFPL